MYQVEKGTLSYALASPVLRRLDLSNQPLHEVAPRIAAYKTGTSKVLPDAEAIRFYFADHIFSVIRSQYTVYEPLPPEVYALVDDLVTIMGAVGARLYAYLMLICTRETRHYKSSSAFTAHAAKFGPAINDFLLSIKGVGSGGAAGAIMSNPPAAKLGLYTEHLEWTFRNASWSGGYGGKAWAEVAKPLNQFANGILSMALMADVGFALAHNNGPIFNKGMLYTQYTDTFKECLDLQRGGQVPGAVMEAWVGGPVSHLEGVQSAAGDLKPLKQKHAILQDYLPPEGLDWMAVIKSNPVTNSAKLGAYYSKQCVWKGVKPNLEGFETAKGHIETPPKQIETAMEAIQALVNKKPEGPHFTVMPSIHLPVVSREG